jgi:hypothetical protein
MHSALNQLHSALNIGGGLGALVLWHAAGDKSPALFSVGGGAQLRTPRLAGRAPQGTIKRPSWISHEWEL